MARGSRLRTYADKSYYVAPVGVGITVATTLVVFFVTTDSLGDVKLLVTLCVALLGASLCLQVETLLTIAERTKARELHGRLLELVEEYPELLPSMTRLTEAASTTLRESDINEFRARVKGVLADAYVSLHELTQGRLRISGIDGRLHNRFSEAKKSLQGTTDTGDTVWWKQDAGREFFEINLKLIARGVQIERLWLLDGAPDAATSQIIDEHAEAGMHVYLVRTRDVEQQYLVNMTIMDESFLHEDVANKHGYAIEYIYTKNEADLLKATARFAELKAHAVRYRDRSSIDILFGQ